LVERFHGMEEARGSNPLSSTNTRLAAGRTQVALRSTQGYGSGRRNQEAWPQTSFALRPHVERFYMGWTDDAEVSVERGDCWVFESLSDGD
jgi:hypothetical protein